MVQWIECQAAKQKVTGSFPQQSKEGQTLEQNPGRVEDEVPGWGCLRGSQSMILSHIDVSLSFSLPSLLSK